MLLSVATYEYIDDRYVSIVINYPINYAIQIATKCGEPLDMVLGTAISEETGTDRIRY